VACNRRGALQAFSQLARFKGNDLSSLGAAPGAGVHQARSLRAHQGLPPPLCPPVHPEQALERSGAGVCLGKRAMAQGEGSTVRVASMVYRQLAVYHHLLVYPGLQVYRQLAVYHHLLVYPGLPGVPRPDGVPPAGSEWQGRGHEQLVGGVALRPRAPMLSGLALQRQMRDPHSKGRPLPQTGASSLPLPRVQHRPRHQQHGQGQGQGQEQRPPLAPSSLPPCPVPYIPI